MKQLILSRLLIAIPLLLAISFTAFLLRDIMESDEINLMEEGSRSINNFREAQLANRDGAKSPLFYFTIQPMAYPDTIANISNKLDRLRLKRFLHQGIAWRDLVMYLRHENEVLKNQDSKYTSSRLEFIHTIQNADDLLTALTALPDSIQTTPEVSAMIVGVHQMIDHKNYVLLFVPSFQWHGSANRYHSWLKSILHGDWGNSRVDYRPSWVKIKEAISWTLTINLIALFLVFGFAIVLGEWLFIHHGGRWGKFVETTMFFMYSIPRFFLAMLLIMLFASDTVNPALHIFPSPGFFDSDPTASVFQRFWRYGNQLLLPIISIVLPSLAYLTRIYANKLQEEKVKPYAFMAWSKGDTPGFVTKHHLRRNAMMPMVALLGLEIPALIGGSVVIEVLFNIPGMGRLMLQSIVMQDWVIVFNILLLTGVFTILGKLISDILYAVLDPRVVWAKQ